MHGAGEPQIIALLQHEVVLDALVLRRPFVAVLVARKDVCDGIGQPVEAVQLGRGALVQAWLQLCRVDEGKSKMLTELASLIGGAKNVPGSTPFLCADFKAHKLKKFSKEVRSQNSQNLNLLADEFEEFHASEVTTQEFADFLHERFGDMPNTAQRYAGMARKLFKHAISRHGFRTDNAIDQLDMGDFETGRREVLLSHKDVELVRQFGMVSKPRKQPGKVLPTASGPMFCCIIDIRMLREDQIEDW